MERRRRKIKRLRRRKSDTTVPGDSPCARSVALWRVRVGGELAVVESEGWWVPEIKHFRHPRRSVALHHGAKEVGRDRGYLVFPV